MKNIKINQFYITSHNQWNENLFNIIFESVNFYAPTNSFNGDFKIIYDNIIMEFSGAIYIGNDLRYDCLKSLEFHKGASLYIDSWFDDNEKLYNVLKNIQLKLML